MRGPRVSVFIRHALGVSNREGAVLGMIIAIMELVPRIEERPALLEILCFIQERVRTKVGCLECAVFEAIDGTGKIQYVERWQSAQDLETHIQSPLYLRLLHAMELAREKPRVSFLTVSRTRSMELVEGLRGKGGRGEGDRPLANP